ncbi:hypothetical protein BGX24_003151 [Mortierella sp. AD032]|nr:hypothetical protein BGX24_003151 [Mortierella sp. AD032]
MVFKSSLTVLLVATLAVFSTYTPQAEAHSWIDCVDWRSKVKGKGQWTAKNGECQGYARRYPVKPKFASLDDADPNRHYQQDHNNLKRALACSDGRAGEEPGADETRAKNIADAYNKNKGWGMMTKTSPGKKLCIRWPAKNHSGDRDGGRVVINWMKDNRATNNKQEVLDKWKLDDLDYSNCDKASNEDVRPCGGCVTVPEESTPGMYLLQWRWRLNKDEWYTSCADVQVTK